MSESPVIIGIDEAGRGALAGPVVAGACVLIDGLAHMPLIRDSKKLSSEQRENAYEWITNNCCFGIGIVEAIYIDTHGILAATEKAMQDAVTDIEKHITPTYLLIDGRDKFWFNYPHSSVVRGDDSEPCIAAASIVAKVTRDKLMISYGESGEYGFQEHKGYGTQAHMEAIGTHGISDLHRRTFLRSILPQEESCDKKGNSKKLTA